MSTRRLWPQFQSKESWGLGLPPRWSCADTGGEVQHSVEGEGRRQSAAGRTQDEALSRKKQNQREDEERWQLILHSPTEKQKEKHFWMYFIWK